MKTKTKRYFPCPICKGQGGWCDDYGDYQQCISYIDCGYCEGLAMIEIGGNIHMRNKYLKAGMDLMNEDREYSYEEIIKMGKARLDSQTKQDEGDSK